MAAAAITGAVLGLYVLLLVRSPAARGKRPRFAWVGLLLGAVITVESWAFGGLRKDRPSLLDVFVLALIFGVACGLVGVVVDWRLKPRP